MSALLTIGDFSRMTYLSVKALRHYHEIGLLEPADVDSSSGYRMYEPTQVPGLERLGATRMRQYVRAWINEWDLTRLDPAFRPQTTVAAVHAGYREQPELDDTSADTEDV